MKKAFCLFLCLLLLTLAGCGNVEQSEEYRALHEAYSDLKSENEALKDEIASLRAERDGGKAVVYALDDLCQRFISRDYLYLELDPVDGYCLEDYIIDVSVAYRQDNLANGDYGKAGTITDWNAARFIEEARSIGKETGYARLEQ